MHTSKILAGLVNDIVARQVHETALEEADPKPCLKTERCGILFLVLTPVLSSPDIIDCGAQNSTLCCPLRIF
jgi:hypothetical protein